MAQETPFDDLIIIPVQDLVYADTAFKQKAHFIELRHRYQHGPYASIDVDVYRYSADPSKPDGYGDIIPNIPPRRFTLEAKNDTLVEKKSGRILASAQDPELDAYSWDEKFPFPTMLQGNYFAWVRDNVEIKMGDLIRFHIVNADRTFNKFA
jgi:hypothetical protein